jgi:hypothetical protein
MANTVTATGIRLPIVTELGYYIVVGDAMHAARAGDIVSEVPGRRESVDRHELEFIIEGVFEFIVRGR